MRPYTLHEAGELIGRNVEGVRTLIHAGKLVALDVSAGRVPRYVIERSELDAYVDRQRVNRRAEVEEVQRREGRVVDFCRAARLRRSKSLART
jgi:hypothetical protein